MLREWCVLYVFTSTPCTFSTSQLSKVLRTRGVFNTLAWKCASRHNGVQFVISHLARWLRTRALASLLFDSPGLQNIGKNTVFRDFSTFSRACIFFLLTLSLPTSAFSCVHIVGSLTSKLPSIRARLSMGGPEGSLSILLIVVVQKCETTPDASSFERRNDTR